jgi:acetyl esterase/lipase
MIGVPLNPMTSTPLPIWSSTPPGFDPAIGQPAPTLTPYLVHSKTPTGLVIVLPGGGYEFKAEYEGGPIAEWLNEVGFSAAVLDYRVAPYNHPYPLLDAKRAIQFVRSRSAEWGVDPQHVGILGFSAGGHLAASTGTHLEAFPEMPDDPVARLGSRPDALILCYAVLSFGQYGHVGSMENLLGPNPPASLRATLSNELQVTRQTPPAFIWQTATDGAVPPENALLFAQALHANGVPFELHIFPAGPHGKALALDDPIVGQWRSLCAAWLKGLGFVTVG